MSASSRPDPQTEKLAGKLSESFSRLSRQLRQTEMPSGMTQERLSALAAIAKYGPISVTALSDREFVRPATISRMVSALVDNGYAKRQPDKTDGRGVLVAVTAKGRKAYQRAQEIRLRQLAEALLRMPGDQVSSMRCLAEALEQLTSVLDE